MLICDIVGVKRIPTVRHFGMEFEIEFPDEAIIPDVPGFKIKKDGSLRGNGFEFIFSQPESYNDTLALIERLYQAVLPLKPTESFRTSTHVHINVSTLQHSQAAAFAYLLYLIDTVLVKYCDSNRNNNRFCLRVKDATYKVTELNTFIKEAMVLAPDGVKYSAVNIAPIAAQGSIEIRSLEGTPPEEKVKAWIHILEKLLTYSTENFTCPKDVELFFLEKQEKFLTSILGDELALELYYDGWLDDVHYNHSLMIMLPEETLQFPFQKDLVKAEPKKKKVNKLIPPGEALHLAAPVQDLLEVRDAPRVRFNANPNQAIHAIDVHLNEAALGRAAMRMEEARAFAMDRAAEGEIPPW